MYAAFVKLLNMSAAASILIAVVIALRFLLRKTPKKYICILWAIVALRLICPISISSAVSAFNYIGHTPQSSGQVEYIHYNGKSEKPKAEVTITIPTESEKNDGPTVTFTKKDFYIPTFFGIWAAGFASMVLYAAYSYTNVRVQVRQSIPLERRNYRRDIYICDYIPSPFILGVVKPKIYLPSTLDREQQDSVIAHERAHLARLDHLWKPLGFLLLSVHWFNPLVWVAYALLCRDIEMACDEKVIAKMTSAQKQAYSTVLLTCSMPRKAITACPLAFGESGVKERVKGILNYRKPTFWVISISIILCIAIAVGFLSNPLRTEDYIRFRRAETKPFQPHSYQFNMQIGEMVSGPIVFAEQWQNGELVQSEYCTIPEGEKNLAVSVTETKDGSEYQVEIDTNPYTAALNATFSLPAGTRLMDVYSWHGAKDIPLVPDKQVLLAAYIFGSDGFMIFDFDNEDFAEAGDRLRNQECAIIAYAVFPAMHVISERPAPFTQEIYQFADELPSGYSLNAHGPYDAALCKDGNMIGRISSLIIIDTDGETEILQKLGYDPSNPAMQYVKGADPDWEFQYVDGDWKTTHYLHRVPGKVYDLTIDGTEPEKKVRDVIVPRLREFLTKHPDAIVPTYTYMLLTEDTEIASINVIRKDHSGGSILSKDEPYAPKSIVWLESLEGMQSIDGITITARNIENEVVWKYTVPYKLGTAERIQDGSWVIRRYCPESESEQSNASTQENVLNQSGTAVEGIPAALSAYLDPAMVEYRDNTLIDKVSAGKQMTLEELLSSDHWTEQPIPDGVTGPGPIRRGLILRAENGDFMVISYDTDALCIFNVNGDCIGRYTGSYTGEQMVDMLWHWMTERLHNGSAYMPGATLTQREPQGMFSILMRPTTALNIDGMGAVTPENQEDWISAWNTVLNSSKTISEEANAETYYGVILHYEDTYLNVHRDGDGFSLREMGGSWYCYSVKDSMPLIELLEPILQELNYSPVKPSELRSIQYANLILDGMRYAIPQGDPKLRQLEAILTSGRPIGYMPACWFTSLLTVGLPSGETRTISVATDSCGAYLSDGVCYEFPGDNAPLYQLFGVDLTAQTND